MKKVLLVMFMMVFCMFSLFAADGIYKKDKMEANNLALEIAPQTNGNVLIKLNKNFRSLPKYGKGMLYDNGPVVNSPGTGTGGSDESILQTSLGLNSLGAGFQFSAGNRIADEFTIAGDVGWVVDSLLFYAYQTGSTTTSTMTGIYVQIWDGDPNDPASAIVFGDLTTNRLVSSYWSNAYRLSDTSPGNTDRPIMANIAEIGFELVPGTYWLDVQVDGSLTSGPWAPAITINGQTTTGNAKQFTTADGWLDLFDETFPQGLPFVVYGEIAADPVDPLPPSSFVVYSDYNTPTGMNLTWDDPTNLANGDTLYASDFTIQIMRNDALIGFVDGGTEVFDDSGLTDGDLYEYKIYAQLVANDSTSSSAVNAWIAGGSPIPAAPAITSVTGTAEEVVINWTNPIINVDQTPLDDFAGIYLYQDGALVATYDRTPGDAGATESETFTPAEAGYYTWMVTAFDNEDPINESMMSNGAVTPIGYPFSEGFEGDLGLFVNGDANGVDWAVTGDYYVEGMYSAHNAYAASNNNILEVVGAMDLTGAVTPKFSFLQICKTEGGYDFGYIEYSLDGGATWLAFAADAYEGAGDYSNGYFHEDSYEDWGTTDVPVENTWWKFEVFDLGAFVGEISFKVRFRLETDGSVQRVGGWLVDGVFIGEPDADPMMAVAPQTLEETLLVNATTTLNFDISNTQIQLSALNYTITESPAVDWLEVVPAAGAISQASSEMITVNLDATGLATDTYTCELIVGGDDPENLYDTVLVTMNVNASPIVGFTPDSLAFELDPGQEDSLQFTITNTGAGPLDFTLTDEDVAGFKRVVKPLAKKYPDYYYGMDVAKEGFDSRRGVTPEKGAGGPDMFGYKWTDSDEPGGPVFNWNDITGTGTEVTGMGDDDYQGPFPIGFAFDFYGEEKTEFYISSNGVVSFSDVEFSFTNQPIPTADAPGDFLAWMWDDLNPSASGQIFYETVGSNLIIQFVNYSEYLTGGGGTVDAQVVLSANGAITYQYLSFKNNIDLIGCTVGIENGDGTDGLEVILNAAYLHDELAVRFSAESGWVSESITEGTIDPGGSMDIWAKVNSSGLLGGDHLAKIIINSNDPVTPETFIPVGLNITGIPVIVVDPVAVDFAEPVFVGGIDSMALNVSNTGTTTLHVTDIVSDNVVYTIDQTAFDLNVGQNVDVMVYFAPTSAVAETGTLTISSDDPANSSLVVNLSGAGIVPPVVGVDPTNIDQDVGGLDSVDVTITISNDAPAGAAALEWAASIGEPVGKFVMPASKALTRSEYQKITQETVYAAGTIIPEKTFTINKGLKSAKGTVEVLMLTPDATDTGDLTNIIAFADLLNSYADLNVTLFNRDNLATLTVADLLPYQVVYVYNDLTWVAGGGDGIVVGNVLADYIDAGGKVVENMYLHSFDQWGLEGRYITEQYAPFTPSTTDNSGSWVLGTIHIPGHPLMKDVAALGTTWGLGVQDVGIAPGATHIADWDNGDPLLAFNESVVAINTMPIEPAVGPTWTGDMPTLFHNAIVWLGGGGSFIELMGEAEGSVDAGGNTALTARIFGLEVADTNYYASVVVASNDPVTPEVIVPVAINVGAVGINNDRVELPTSFDVQQNYPNPFNPSTTIKYQLPKAADVKLVIYNLMGQKVRTLINKNVTAGSYDIIWNGINDAGAQVSSGVYIYRFEAGDFIKMKKMILLK